MQITLANVKLELNVYCNATVQSLDWNYTNLSSRVTRIITLKLVRLVVAKQRVDSIKDGVYHKEQKRQWTLHGAGFNHVKTHHSRLV